MVTPVLAWWREPSGQRVDPREVHAVLREPIEELLDPAHRISVRHPSGWKAPAFLIGRQGPHPVGLHRRHHREPLRLRGLDPALGRLADAGPPASHADGARRESVAVTRRRHELPRALRVPL